MDIKDVNFIATFNWTKYALKHEAIKIWDEGDRAYDDTAYTNIRLGWREKFAPTMEEEQHLRDTHIILVISVCD